MLFLLLLFYEFFYLFVEFFPPDSRQSDRSARHITIVVQTCFRVSKFQHSAQHSKRQRKIMTKCLSQGHDSVIVRIERINLRPMVH